VTERRHGLARIQVAATLRRMREQASLIQREVGLLLNDVRLLSDRVGKLQTHLGQADGDIKTILISAGKVTSRAERIETVDLTPSEATPQLIARQA